MARKILTISNIFKINDKIAVLGGGLSDQNISNDDLKKIAGSPITISDADNSFIIQALHVQISSSLVELRNIFVSVDIKYIEKIKEGDIVSVN